MRKVATDDGGIEFLMQKMLHLTREAHGDVTEEEMRQRFEKVDLQNTDCKSLFVLVMAWVRVSFGMEYVLG